MEFDTIMKVMGGYAAIDDNDRIVFIASDVAELAMRISPETVVMGPPKQSLGKILPQVLEHINDGDLIPAVKMMRAEFGMGLMECRTIVKGIERMIREI